MGCIRFERKIISYNNRKEQKRPQSNSYNANNGVFADKLCYSKLSTLYSPPATTRAPPDGRLTFFDLLSEVEKEDDPCLNCVCKGYNSMNIYSHYRHFWLFYSHFSTRIIDLARGSLVTRSTRPLPASHIFASGEAPFISTFPTLFPSLSALLGVPPARFSARATSCLLHRRI